jgi:hypothetical protein
MLYLDAEQLKSSLSLGKPVEQWLGNEETEEYTVLKWLRVEKEPDGKYTVIYIECFDEGNDDFVDIYEFSALDPDSPFGVINSFSSIADAIGFSIENYGASSLKFVAEGMIQEEYIKYLNIKNR